MSNTGLLKASASAAILTASLAVTACAPVHTAPVAVAASNPTITYVYHNDAELLQANDQASGYCAQYQSGPHLVRYDQGPDGRIAVFECVQGGPVGPVAAGPGPVYGAPTPIAYDSYYDDYYGPYYGGYWGGDGFFYYSDGPGRPYHRDDFHHFRHDETTGFHGVRSVVHTG
ncbi:MAG TPA: hypothetical protein VH722_19320 [Alphaproteobacteria bacterium]|nr:hypothetical protein [Alphaproteobacteria bacterium]